MTGAFTGWDEKQARAFTDRWMPAWTGNDPARLIGFYAGDAYYRDPAVPEGLSGQELLGRYFEALLARFPTWVWTTTHTTPLEGGFLNHWSVAVPIGQQQVEERGVCTVILNEREEIIRNEVHFDRSGLLVALAEAPA